MNKYTVTTDRGEFRDVWASSPFSAARKVIDMCYSRVRVFDVKKAS